jgi:hypothetical protein
MLLLLLLLLLLYTVQIVAAASPAAVLRLPGKQFQGSAHAADAAVVLLYQQCNLRCL